MTGSLAVPPVFEPEPLTLPSARPPLLGSVKRLEPVMDLAAGEMFNPDYVRRPSVTAVPPADLALMQQALTEYRRNAIAAGDLLAERIEDEAARAALEWSVIRLKRQGLGSARIARFVSTHGDFPMRAWLIGRIEDALFVEQPSPESVFWFYGDRLPSTATGMVVLARALKQRGEGFAARELARRAYRDGKTNAALRSAITREFSGLITAADQRYLAERLIYDGESAEGLRVAAEAGPLVQQIAQVLTASVNETGALAGLLNKLDPALQREPPVIFARAQHLRRSNAYGDAARALLSVPADSEAIIDGDEWWIERRLLSRKLLDAGEPLLAYRIVATHQAESAGHRVDAEVQAGWIALRFLGEAEQARQHFETARQAAETPHAQARAQYWLGRAGVALGDPAAMLAYGAAAQHRHAFHGQLALAELGATEIGETEVRLDVGALELATRTLAVRTIRALLDAEARDLAQPLIVDAAKTAPTLEANVALGDLVARYNLPRLTVIAGKMAMQSGRKAEEHAFPTFGIPPFEATQDSAEAAIVYSIARQESEFEAGAVSHAGARGLMQLMPATARATASRNRLPFDVGALTRDASLNARIGAAHLGELFREYNGSYLLAFAAYNAGGGRVKEWIAAYGDPRDPAIDPIDWIERIPITETRHYVQKILENVQIYRMRLSGNPALGIAADLKRGLRAPRPQALSGLAETAPAGAARP